jgi:hypothetical protein
MTLFRIAVSFLVMSLALGISACGKSEEAKDAKKPEAAAAKPPAADTAPKAGAAAEPAGGITARAKFDQVMTEAGKWQTDAELFSTFSSLEETGAVDFWLYDFQSRATKTCTRLIVFANGQLKTTEASHDCRIRKPVTHEFVDSPTALKSAVAAGLKIGTSVEMSLRFLKDNALSTPRACWVIWSEFDSGDAVIRSWCVDPATGAFVTRLSGYGGPVFE